MAGRNLKLCHPNVINFIKFRLTAYSQLIGSKTNEKNCTKNCLLMSFIHYSSSFQRASMQRSYPMEVRVSDIVLVKIKGPPISP